MDDTRVDAYIDRASEFAQPILRHVRKLMHQACPEIEETIKWSRPFFLYRGKMVGNISAFKAHCSVGLWGPGMTAMLKEGGILGDDASGSLGRIESLKDLPKDAVLKEWIKTACKLVEEQAAGPKSVAKPVRKAAKAELVVPHDFSEELGKVAHATEHFEAMSPSCRKEYVQWIVEAKRSETRAKRIGEAVGWIAEGKRRNWKYENC